MVQGQVMRVGARPFPAGVPEPAGRDHPVPPPAAGATWPRSSTSSSARLRKLLADRKIGLELDAAALEWLAERGLRPGLWRAAAEAGDPAEPAGPAGQPAAGRPHPRRRAVAGRPGLDGLEIEATPLAEAA